MAETKIVPYTEEELYVLPVKEPKPVPAKSNLFPVIPIAASSTSLSQDVGFSNQASASLATSQKIQASFFGEYKTIFIILGVVRIAVGTLYFYQRYQENRRREEPPN